MYACRLATKAEKGFGDKVPFALSAYGSGRRLARTGRRRPGAGSLAISGRTQVMFSLRGWSEASQSELKLYVPTLAVVEGCDESARDALRSLELRGCIISTKTAAGCPGCGM